MSLFVRVKKVRLISRSLTNFGDDNRRLISSLKLLTAKNVIIDGEGSDYCYNKTCSSEPQFKIRIL